MFLLIDNSADEMIVFHGYVDNSWIQKQYLAQKYSVVGALEQFLRDVNKRLPDLCGLAVVIGKGKFTATRIAVTVANALAYALKVPVLTVDGWVENLHDRIVEMPVGQYVSAKYSGEANIGKKK